MTKEKSYFKSSNNSDNIAYYVYKPDGVAPKAVVQLVHGMREYMERYEEFARFLCENGILVCGHDHLGHGSSVVTNEYLGYFANEKGWQYIVKDTLRLTQIIQNSYPSLPYFIIGHSMGSLAVKAIIPKYSYMYDGAVLSGTLNAKTGMDAAYIYMKALGRLKGGFYRPVKIDKLLNVIGNLHLPKPDDSFAWVSREASACEDYVNNPLCNYSFTVSAYADLIMMLMYTSDKNWADRVNKGFPILICSGAEDCVGNYGKDAAELYAMLEKAGCEQVGIKLYDGARHEILNETNRDEVFGDLLEWLGYHMYELEE